MKERHIDIQNLKRYPEFHALKVELEEFCNALDSLSDLEASQDSRISLESEVSGRIWARDKVRDLLSTLGLVDKSVPKVRDRTGD